jgi:hypothetical protein
MKSKGNGDLPAGDIVERVGRWKDLHDAMLVASTEAMADEMCAIEKEVASLSAKSLRDVGLKIWLVLESGGADLEPNAAAILTGAVADLPRLTGGAHTA